MERLLRRVYSSKKISTSLKIVSHATVVIYVSAFLAMLVLFYLSEPMSALKLALAAGVPFILVSIVRRIINAPRPYQLYDFYEVLPKSKQGRSFPSRHVFSAFVIAVFALTVSVWLSLLLFVLGIALSVARVLLGIHFVRDVAAGALIGIISAILGIVILF
jgi:membrane-associated phospholipid phosphatase